MALVNNGTKVSIPAGQLPTGYTSPTPTEFTDYEYVRESTKTVTKALHAAASAVTTFTAVVADINSQVSTEVTADYDTTGLTVTVWSEITSYRISNTLSGNLFTNAPDEYYLTVKSYIKTA